MIRKEKYNVAVLGATGMVGIEMVKVLEQRDFPVDKLLPLASERSSGKKVSFKGKQIDVIVLERNSFEGVDIALFSAGATISKEFAPIAAKAGAVVIDVLTLLQLSCYRAPTVPTLEQTAKWKLPLLRWVALPA